MGPVFKVLPANCLKFSFFWHLEVKRIADCTGGSSLEKNLISPGMFCLVGDKCPKVDLQETYDPVGLLLMIRINHSHQLIMNRRRVPCLEGYLDRINLMLWPRFKVWTLSIQILL